MSLTHPKYITLRDLILKSEGKTIEDEFDEIGCYYSCYPGKSIWQYVGYDGSKRYYLDEDGIFTSCIADRDEVLGREISLDRILMALTSNKCEFKITGSNLKYLHVDDLKDKEVINLALCKPLHDQPEETWDQLIKILS